METGRLRQLLENVLSNALRFSPPGGVSWLCYFQALKLGPVSRVAPIDKLSVVLVALLGVLVLGEQLSVRGWLGVVLMGIGAALVAWH